MWKEKYKTEFKQKLGNFTAKLKNYVSTDNGEWSVKGFIDVYRNVYAISTDTKIVSKILEIHIFPQILRFADEIGYKIILTEHQNYYPDLTFMNKENESVMFAVDLKTTYRKKSGVSSFTLGSHGSYFKERDKKKNIQFPYNQYLGHFCLGVIYTRTDEHTNTSSNSKIYQVNELRGTNEQIEKGKPTTVNDLKSITSVIKDFDFFIAEKWKIASDKQGSGNTANIGSTLSIDDLRNENGIFSRLGEEWFDEYWINFGSATMVKNDLVTIANQTGTWMEPFLGTGVVAFNSGYKKAILSDTNPHLIRFYKEIQSKTISASSMKQYLEEEGNELRNKGYEHYLKVRSRFNNGAFSPYDFIFLSRAGFNGMMRFGRKGNWNIPFCKKPNRFAQAYITKITNQVALVSQIIQPQPSWTFHNTSFEDIIPLAMENDIIYCDPPYYGRHVDYYNGWKEKDEEVLFKLLSETKAKFILSTWHHNDWRENEMIKRFWKKFNLVTKDHFYHNGGNIENRRTVVEALVCNFDTNQINTHNHGEKVKAKEAQQLEMVWA
ncbi:hypothetical protein CHS0354_000518 [Potamilus streckersoni]|uniref:site-specific DNA-methyltransferase (adenine-specific) n=1 Tax=Potamilus streckersoni TaxID=2493646 RepID=A0AAE0T735_9BIVA|nr:hypothetical protein CHS0354_000518 [Potamilus streckersoni]